MDSYSRGLSSFFPTPSIDHSGGESVVSFVSHFCLEDLILDCVSLLVISGLNRTVICTKERGSTKYSCTIASVTLWDVHRGVYISIYDTLLSPSSHKDLSRNPHPRRNNDKPLLRIWPLTSSSSLKAVAPWPHGPRGKKCLSKLISPDSAWTG